ncbi:Tyrosine/DOPA decarboxylase 2 [Ananas comosus]|uniref:Tyrosine/DOPA decarboxylase 2 n=1 Tax=Ananas comosus TaxID=4615 RepID=A0A199UWL0_ANACO|nr:Tyrosine/DOPA decarboxylase 2 [Ananas comosus]
MGSLDADVLKANAASSPANPLDPEEFRRQAHVTVDFLADYYRDVGSYPVRSQVEPGYLRELLPASAPDHPEPLDAILRDVATSSSRDHALQSPSFFAYFQCCGSTAGFLGEMLSTGFNVVGFNWVSSPAATELESIVMDWLGSTLALPKPFLFSAAARRPPGTTCEAILCTLAAARDRMLRRIGRDGIGKLVVYGSDRRTAAAEGGPDRRHPPANFRAVKTYKEDHFGCRPRPCAGRGRRRGRGLSPCSCAPRWHDAVAAVDLSGALRGAAEKGCGCTSTRRTRECVHLPEFRGSSTRGGADSFSFNAHKWLFTTLDCCCLWATESRASWTTRTADRAEPALRALKLWMVLRSYGLANLRNFLRSHVRMAKDFEEMVAADGRFEVVVPRYFAMVCFRLLRRRTGGGEETAANEINQRLLEAANASGRCT